MPDNRYQFGDAAVASKRLAVLARVFEPSTDALLMMFSMNVAAWRENDWIQANTEPGEVDSLASEIEEAGSKPGVVRWRLRQLAWTAA